MTITKTQAQMESRVKEALSNIAAVRGLDGKTVIDLPLMYPSGAMVVVEVQSNKDRFWVSDMGHGLVEAEYMAAQEFFGAAGKSAATSYNVEFDGYSIFALWVSPHHLEAAIICVANASTRASHEAIRKASEAQGSRQNEKVYGRIVEVFGSKVVAKRAELKGKHAVWDAHNVVTLPNSHRAVFEFMTIHSNSVSSKYLMFSDLKSRDEEISLNAVVTNLNDLDVKAQMISDLANIVPLNAEDNQIRQFAQAA